ncbi:MAG: hypothetical protein CMJ80_08985 [Planctomycetaceae bacterium]|nr:hypothetical protein [Planctomycetaceae bacterium]
MLRPFQASLRPPFLRGRRSRWSRRLLRGESLESRHLLTGTYGVSITEFGADNNNTLTDVDGDSSDWVEIFNNGSDAVDLTGWHLTDDVTRLQKWEIPTVSLAAGDYLIVYASGKNRVVAGEELHTNFRIARNGGYLALVEPNGTTIASKFNYPGQFEDVSFGVPMSDFPVSDNDGESGGNLGSPLGAIPITDIQVLRERQSPGDALQNNTRLGGGDAIDGNLDTWNYLTPSATQGPHLAVLDMGEIQLVNRLRVAKWGDTDGTGASGGAPGRGAIDNMDLQILFTTDTGPMVDRTYLPVSGLTNGFAGMELIHADAVNAADATVNNDHHDFLVDGWYSLVFDEVQATAIAVRFVRDAGDSQPWTHYRVSEFQLFEPSSLVRDQNVSIVAVDQFPGPGGAVRNRGDESQVIDDSLTTSSLLTQDGTDRTHGAQRVAVDLGASTMVNRLRVFKEGDLDENSTGDMELIDPVDLFILYTTDTGPLDQRNYQPVNQLTRGYNGTEQIEAAFVDFDAGKVQQDRHDSPSSGFYSLTFAPVAATGIAIEFIPSDSDGNGRNHYHTHEIQVLHHPDAVLVADPGPGIASLVTDTSARFYQRPTPGAINRSGPLGPAVDQQADSIVVFSEIMYHPATDDAGQQWIELYNQLGVDVDISGWSLTGGVYYEFPSGTILPGGAYLVVASDAAALATISDHTNAMGPLAGNFSNGGQKIALRNNSGRIMDSLDYVDTHPWPVGPDGSGATLSKWDPNTASGAAENWTHSQQVGGTPGKSNFPDANIDFVSETLLATGAATTARVPRNDTLGTTWIDLAFTDDDWLDGTTGVGFDNSVGYDSLLGLDLDDPPNGQMPTPMFRVNSTVYVRVPFSVTGDLDRFDLLILKMKYDDGFVAYLNGTEIARDNAPEVLGWNAAAERNRPDRTAKIFQQFNITEHRGLLTTETDNILAIHGLNRRSTNGDMLVVPEIEGRTKPPGESSEISLTINEVAGGNDANFFVEFANIGEDPIVLDGFVLSAAGSSDGEYVFPTGLLEAGQYVSLSASQLGFTPTEGDRLFLYRPDRQAVLDARRVTERLRGRSDDHNNDWLWPTTATPGADNVFEMDDSIVISEIMYHHAPRRSAEEIPAEYDATGVIEFDAVWRYNQSGVDLGTSWADATHAVDNVNWFSGAGLLGVLELSGPLNNRGDQNKAIDGDLSTRSYLTPSATTDPNAVAVDLGATRTVSRLRVSKWGEADGTAAGTPGIEPFDSLDLQILYTTDTGPLNQRAYVPVSGLTSGYLGSELIVANGLDPTNATVDGDHHDFDADGFYSLTFDAVAATGISIRFERDANDTAPWTHYYVNEIELRDGASDPLPIFGIDVFRVADLPHLSSSIATYLRPGPQTFYFESDFVFRGNLTDVDALGLTHVIDDGAVFYLNGQEILRTNLVDGPVAFDTQAASSVGTPSTQFDVVAPTWLQQGTNRLSVEVHQRDAEATPSMDVLMATKLQTLVEVAPGEPARSFEAIGEEWIEIYNRGESAVDLGGWQLDDAVNFEFSATEILGPGQYLVVAKDADAMANKFDGIRIAGGFNGTLSNRGERIVLRDANRNPADEVQYYPAGRWPAEANGGSSTLELRDPDADNSQPESWRASDERHKSQWKSFSYRGIAAPGVGPNTWNEFVIGLLDDGELLIDDISIIEDPEGNAVELIQNGAFESDTVGWEADSWRVIGSHNATVVLDPEDAGNKVLHLVATSATKDTHNHGETTLLGNTTIDVGREYEVSFRAKWISGSNQLNFRLFFNKLGDTVVLPIPELNGTPGAENSRREPNIGPSMFDVRHAPVLPIVGQAVTITARIEDSDAVASATLWYSVDGSGWSSAPMSMTAGDVYSALIDSQPSGAIVQFYVAATDGLGKTSTFPAAGPDSRALYQVFDSQDGVDEAHNFRLIVTNADSSFMLQNVHRMSNARLGATVIYNGTQVYYDVGARLKGSPFGRSGNEAVGLNVRFNADQPFRGIHDTVAIDRSGLGSIGRTGQDEILTKHITNHAGDIPGMYDDVIHFVDSQRLLTGGALLQMARFDDTFLESQFGAGGDDQSVFNFDVVHILDTTTDGGPESPKRITPAFLRQDIEDLGDDKDDYRWNFKLRNNRARDDFEAVIQMAQAWSLAGTELDMATKATMDVDQWMRKFAMVSLVGSTDTYGHGSPHNLNFYVRPSDQKVIVMPCDLDGNFSLATSRSLWSDQADNNNLRKIIELPANTRLFYGHLYDLINTTFNTDYMEYWTEHYGRLANEGYGGILRYIGQRAEFVESQLPNKIEFEITTNDGDDVALAESNVTLQGRGWIDVRHVYRTGDPKPLDVVWTDADNWQVTVPLSSGENELQLLAFDFYDNLVGSDTITVTSSVSASPVQEYLRITEIHYNPVGSDDSEFIELRNVSTSAEAITLDLSFVSITEGPGEPFVFPVGTTLAAGEYALIIKDRATFQSLYPNVLGSRVIGEFDGSLSNAGETITLLVGRNTVQQFTFDDAWYPTTDGGGYSLEIVDDLSTDVTSWSGAAGWRPSGAFGGTPGASETAGDFDGNGTIDDVDIDLLASAIRLEDTDAAFDLNSDGTVDWSDREMLIREVLNSREGDSNLDGVFDLKDLLMAKAGGEYDDVIAGNSGWADGDWNGDGDFDSDDLVLAFQAGNFTFTAHPALRSLK